MRQVRITILPVIQHWKMFYLELLVWLKIIILIRTNILDMVLFFLFCFVFVHVPTQGLDSTTLTVKKYYSIYFTENIKKFC